MHGTITLCMHRPKSLVTIMIAGDGFEPGTLGGSERQRTVEV